MAEKKVIVDIDINADDIRAAREAQDAAAKSMREYQQEVNALKTQQKEINALYKIGAIDSKEYAKQQTDVKVKLAETNKNLREANKTLQNNKTVVDAAKGSNEQLRARLALLTKEYNGLSKEQRENTKSGQQMQANIKALSDKLKANEKAVGDNRRNVGNYEEAIKGVAGQINVMGVNLGGLVNQLTTFRDGVKASIEAQKAQTTVTQGSTFATNALGLAMKALPFVALLALLAPIISFFTKTKRGAELLSQAFAGISATISVLVDRASGLVDAFIFLKNGEYSKAADKLAGSFKGIGEEIANEAAEAVNLEKKLQALTDAERNLTVERAKSRAEIKELNKIAEDTTKTLNEREAAAVKAIEIEQGLLDKQVKLAQERFDIIKAQNEQGESLAEDLDRQAEAEKALADIRLESFELQTTLQNKLNTIRQQDQSERAKISAESKKQTEEEIKAEQARVEAITKGYQDERALIDEVAELERNKAIISIANEEERAAKIAYIDKQALLDKIASINEEVTEETAAADAISAIDEEKYAKQLAERAKYEAMIASMDRAAAAEAFTNKVELLNGQEKLDIEAAEFAIENTNQLEAEKYRISLKYAELRLELMRENAMLDGLLTEEERQKLQEVENTIKRLRGLIVDNEGGATLADMLGLSEEQLGKIQSGINDVSQILQSVQGLVSANAEKRIQEIETENQYQVQAIENSALSEEEKAKKIEAINRKAADEKYKIEVEQFKVGKALSIALAIANTATAVVAQLSNPTPYAGFVLAALAAATGAVQIATIASQKPPPPPKFADGGILGGLPHSQGGTQLYGRDGAYYGEAEAGEPILTKGVSKDPYLLQKASEINVAAGGRPLVKSSYMAAGGIASPTFAARQATSSNTLQLEARIDQLGDRIEQMQPVVRVTDINRINGQTVKVQQSADL